MKLNIKIKEIFKNFENQKRNEEQEIKNIDTNLDVNVPNSIAQTKNLLIEINENGISKEEFNLEFETFQLWIIIFNERIHTKS